MKQYEPVNRDAELQTINRKKFSETWVPSCFPTSSLRHDALAIRNLTYFIVLFWVDRIIHESKHKPCF